jgi:hypothetical protein
MEFTDFSYFGYKKRQLHAAPQMGVTTVSLRLVVSRLYKNLVTVKPHIGDDKKQTR